MEGVEASPEYEEMKPTLDVIKQTVLLAMLQQVRIAMKEEGGGGTESKQVCVYTADVRFAPPLSEH